MNVQIERATIYGFGKWIDTTFSFSHGRLHCFYGENEVGKSTLQQFIQFILFGLPPRKRAKFYPKASTRFGGSLTVYDKRFGVVTIERTEQGCRCQLTDGTERDEEWLQEKLLSGMTHSLYRSIYAFSARDLAIIRKMKREHLSDVLFSVSLTGATAIYEIERTLEKKLDELFKPTGKRPRLNEALVKTDKLYRRLHKLQETDASYTTLIQKKLALEKTLATKEKALIQLREEFAHLKQQHDLYAVISEYKTVSEKLASVKENLHVPERGSERLEQWKKQLFPVQSEHERLIARIAELKEAYERLKTKREKEVEMREQLQQLLQKQKMYERYVMQLEEIKRQIKVTEEKITTISHNIGIEPSVAERYEFPYELEHECKHLKQTGEQLQLESDKLQTTYQLFIERKLKLEKEKRQLEEKLAPESERFYWKNIIDTFEHRHGQKASDEQRERKKLVRSVNMLAIFTALSLLLPVFMQETLLWIVPLSLSLFTLWQYYSVRTLANTFTKEHRTVTANEYDEAKRKMEDYEKRLAKLRTIEHELERVALTKRQWEEEKVVFAQKESDWIQRVQRLAQAYPFLDKLEPITWYDILGPLRELKQLAHTLHVQKEEMERKQTYVRAVEDMLQSLQNDRGRTRPLTMADVQEKVLQMKRDEEKEQQLLEEINTLEDEKKSLAKEISHYEREIEQLFALANVTDEESFYEKVKRYEEKRSLIERKEKLYKQLRSTFSNQSIEYILNEQKDRTELQQQLDLLEAKMSEYEKQIATLNRDLATLEVKLNELESSAERSETNFQFYVERDKTYELAKQYTFYKVAYTAIKKAKERYQARFLKEVLERTKAYFSQLTNGAYTNVFAPREDSVFQVEAKNNVRYTVEELSEGTVDQLYIALRLAIGNVMYKRFRLPFLIDDAFLHFDDARTKQFIRLLHSFHDERQIFVFTCKRSIAQLFTPAVVEMK